MIKKLVIIFFLLNSSLFAHTLLHTTIHKGDFFTAYLDKKKEAYTIPHIPVKKEEDFPVDLILLKAEMLIIKETRNEYEYKFSFIASNYLKPNNNKKTYHQAYFPNNRIDMLLKGKYNFMWHYFLHDDRKDPTSPEIDYIKTKQQNFVITKFPHVNDMLVITATRDIPIIIR